MASGFFLGGLADSLQTGITASNQAKYQQGILQLEQQRLQQQQHNELINRADKERATLLDGITHFADAYNVAHQNDPPEARAKAISKAVSGYKQMLMQQDKILGRDPSSTDAQIAMIAATPPKSQTARAMAEATGEAGLRQSEVQKNQAATQNYRANAGLPVVDTNNPDRPGLPQNGPALGQRAKFNQRFAQSAVTEAPKVLSWGDARAAVADKYGPDIASKAELWLKGNTSVVTGLRGGRGGEREKIQNAAMELGRYVGMTADQINQNFVEFAGKKAAATAGGRTAGQREANLGIILTAADSAIDAAITASNNVPRSNLVPLTRAQQLGQAAISDPNLKVFQQKNLQLAELWAKSFNPTGVLRNEDRALALDILTTALGQGTYETAARAIRDSIGLEKGAAVKFLKERGFSGALETVTKTYKFNPDTGELEGSR